MPRPKPPSLLSPSATPAPRLPHRGPLPSCGRRPAWHRPSHCSSPFPYLFLSLSSEIPKGRPGVCPASAFGNQMLTSSFTLIFQSLIEIVTFILLWDFVFSYSLQGFRILLCAHSLNALRIYLETAKRKSRKSREFSEKRPGVASFFCASIKLSPSNWSQWMG